jgi:phage terminase large subunit
MIVQTKVPRWAVPLLPARRYKGAKGGRSGGKSHFFVEQTVAKMAADPRRKVIGIREVQKSIRYSVKELVEAKIEELKVGHLFDVQRDVILHKRGPGLMHFTGMQDHTADSVKGLESFDQALIDEANQISARSLRLLTPTMRKQGSELWFGWNPENEDDPVDRFFRDNAGHPDFACVEVNIPDNPFVSDTGWAEYVRDRDRARNNPNDWAIFEHVWHGAYNLMSDRIVFAGKYAVEAFEPQPGWDGPYYGCDFGFAQDPTTFVEKWRHGNTLYYRRAAGRVGLELDETAKFAADHLPGIEKHVIRADSARPESISYLARHGLPRIVGVDKWKGSVEDGIAFMRSHDRIVIHPEAEPARKEHGLYRYKVNKAGDILPEIEDADNHYIDAGRYAVSPLIQAAGAVQTRELLL